MRTDISEFKKVMTSIAGNDVAASRSWSVALRSARADVGTTVEFSTAIVDAVFDDEQASFASVKQENGTATSSGEQESIGVENLAAQLEMLENQCLNLRRLLNLAILGQ